MPRDMEVIPEAVWKAMCPTCWAIAAHLEWCPRREMEPRPSVVDLLVGFAQHCREQEVFASVYENPDQMKELAREFLRQR